jgi:N-methylhydantoinase A
MSFRLGVDVGGTFTKAVAVDMTTGLVAAQAVTSTTHTDAQGVAAGVVDVVTRLTDSLGADDVDLVTHSTTQAVNAMLEGDVVTVGVVGMGRGSDLRQARRRTTSPRIELAEGRVLTTVSEFIDVTDGLTLEVACAVVARLRDAGAGAIAAAEAFSPDDITNEATVAAAAVSLGMPVTMSTELTGLYGLELRAVTAALNASIVPIAIRTADVVEEGVRAAGIRSPVMVMRGDGGATDLAGFRAAPARTLYSGPAASVAGVLRTARVDDAVILEVGGTSTNVAAIRRGQPSLSYVRVASHSTAIRAIDVRVIGVAGGSMLRARRNRVYGVGPRSAHISALPYACFLTSDEMVGAEAELVAPRPGDPADYLIVRLADGRRAAVTLTCAANALDIVEAGDYAKGDASAATAAFGVIGRQLGLAPAEVARRMLQAATQAIGDLVASVVKEHELTRPALVAVGGGAGGLGRAVAAAMGLELVVPEHAEIISAVGDALSLVRVERERTLDHPTPAEIDRLVAEVESEAIAAGASASSIEARVEQLADRGVVRVIVTGAIGLSSGALPGRPAVTAEDVAAIARVRGFDRTAPVGRYWLATAAAKGSRVVLLDQYGDVVLDVAGEALPVPHDDPDAIGRAVSRSRRHIGPVTIEPSAWVVSGQRCLHVADVETQTIVNTVALLAIDGQPATLLVGRD